MRLAGGVMHVGMTLFVVMMLMTVIVRMLTIMFVFMFVRHK